MTSRADRVAARLAQLKEEEEIEQEAQAAFNRTRRSANVRAVHRTIAPSVYPDWGLPPCPVPCAPLYPPPCAPLYPPPCAPACPQPYYYPPYYQPLPQPAPCFLPQFCETAFKTPPPCPARF